MARFASVLFLLTACLQAAVSAAVSDTPNIVLVMADDMGWGQTGYNNHPLLKTPNLDSMAANGLRFDRFYAGAPNCSPTRATVMTGRTNDRTGVTNHGVPLRPQERTIAQIMQEAGYATAHFGKWHLNGMKGPGAPILADDIRSPGRFGFATWLSVTNFFDMNPILSRMGTFEEFEGDSSEIVVDEALKFIRQQATAKQPSFTVIWYGTPHSPFVAFDKDKTEFGELDNSSANHYGELVAMDRSIGTLRKGLRDAGVADDTLFWFCGDNGGLPRITPETVGGLRGFKNTIYEGGLRVPGIIEWPAQLKPRVTQFPACTIDILPTLIDIVGVPAPQRPIDGVSLTELFETELPRRDKPIGFRHTERTAFIDNNYKLVDSKPQKKGKKMPATGFELYDVVADPGETNNLIASEPDVARRLIAAWKIWNASVDNSVAGKDYPEGEVIPPDPGGSSWPALPQYKPWLEEWKDRPEFKRYIKID